MYMYILLYIYVYVYSRKWLQLDEFHYICIMYIFLLFLLDPKLSLLKNPSEKFNVRYIFILIKKRIEFICIFL